MLSVWGLQAGAATDSRAALPRSRTAAAWPPTPRLSESQGADELNRTALSGPSNQSSDPMRLRAALAALAAAATARARPDPRLAVAVAALASAQETANNARRRVVGGGGRGAGSAGASRARGADAVGRFPSQARGVCAALEADRAPWRAAGTGRLGEDPTASRDRARAGSADARGRRGADA